MIIFLNGVSSSGKSSISKELQIILDDLFLDMSIDKFMSMVPSKFQGFGQNAQQMWSWQKISDEKGELVSLKLGEKGKSYILGMYECIKIMAGRKFNIIVDDVCLDYNLLQQIALKLNTLTAQRKSRGACSIASTPFIMSFTHYKRCTSYGTITEFASRV